MKKKRLTTKQLLRTDDHIPRFVSCVLFYLGVSRCLIVFGGCVGLPPPLPPFAPPPPLPASPSPLSPSSPPAGSRLFPPPSAAPSLPSTPATTPSPGVPPLSPTQRQRIADNRNRALAILHQAASPSSDLSPPAGSLPPPSSIAVPPVDGASCRTIAIRQPAPRQGSWQSAVDPGRGPIFAFFPAGRPSPASLVPTPAPPPPPARKYQGLPATHAQVLQLLLSRAQDDSIERRQTNWLSQHTIFQLWQSSTEENCPICQHSIARMEAVATTGCIHHFHAMCLSHGQSRALPNYGLCPTCRSPLTSLEVYGCPP